MVFFIYMSYNYRHNYKEWSGKMLILVGPSATGKSAIVKCLQNTFKMEKFVTCTTRSPRVGEIDGVDYHFMTRDEFLNHLAEGDFIESVCYNNNFYGTLKSEVSDNKVVILEPDGVRNFYAQLSDLYSIFLNTSENVRIERMRMRGDSEESISMRVTSDRIIFDLDLLPEIDYVLDTSILSCEELAKIVYEKYKNAQNNSIKLKGDLS